MLRLRLKATANIDSHASPHGVGSADSLGTFTSFTIGCEPGTLDQDPMIPHGPHLMPELASGQQGHGPIAARQVGQKWLGLRRKPEKDVGHLSTLSIWKETLCCQSKEKMCVCVCSEASVGRRLKGRSWTLFGGLKSPGLEGPRAAWSVWVYRKMIKHV